MSMKTDLRGLLADDHFLMDLVDTRVSWGLRDKKEHGNAITLTLISGVPDYHLKGTSRLVTSRVQADIWAVTYTAADDMAAALKRCVIQADAAGDIGGIHAITIDSERDLTDSSQPDILFRISIDLSIDHYQED
jgi:hypothetical protein